MMDIWPLAAKLKFNAFIHYCCLQFAGSDASRSRFKRLSLKHKWGPKKIWTKIKNCVFIAKEGVLRLISFKFFLNIKYFFTNTTRPPQPSQSFASSFSTSFTQEDFRWDLRRFAELKVKIKWKIILFIYLFAM